MCSAPLQLCWCLGTLQPAGRWTELQLPPSCWLLLPLWLSLSSSGESSQALLLRLQLVHSRPPQLAGYAAQELAHHHHYRPLQHNRYQ